MKHLIDYSNQTNYLIELKDLVDNHHYNLTKPSSLVKLNFHSYYAYRNSTTLNFDANQSFLHYANTLWNDFKAITNDEVSDLFNRYKHHIYNLTQQDSLNGSQYLLIQCLLNTFPKCDDFDSFQSTLSEVFELSKQYIVHKLSPNDATKESFHALLLHSKVSSQQSFLILFVGSEVEFYTIPTPVDDEIIYWCLSMAASSTIKPTRAIEALRNLWIYQINQSKTKFNSQVEIPRMNSLLYDFLKAGFSSGIHTSVNDLKITFYDIILFMNQLTNGSINSDTQKVQEWLGDGSSDSKDFAQYVTTIQNHINFNHLDKNLSYASHTEKQNLIKQFSKDNAFNSRFSIGKILKVNYDSDNRPGDSTFWGIHGTKKISLNSILLNGFKTNDELYKSSNKNYQYTASGLGDGVYFAQLYQLNKSANYTGSQKSTFLFVCSVKYHKDKVYTTTQYENGLKAKGYEMVYGKKVGTGGIDEMVAKNSSAVRIEYLVEIIRK